MNPPTSDLCNNAGDGWRGIWALSPLDLRVGASFTGQTALAMHAALRDAAATITRMPATYLTYPSSSQPVFEVKRRRSMAAPHTCRLDSSFLWSFGEVRLPLHLWRALSRFNAWIEPALVAEWCRLMDTYAARQGRVLDPVTVARAMMWTDPARDVRFARFRALELLDQGPLYCVWSGRRLSTASLDIDHCMPWAAWPCEDLWNLLPADPAVNRNLKRDRLPSAAMLEQSRERMQDWWTTGHLQRDQATGQRFNSEAQATLLMPASANALPESLYFAVQRRRMALRADQRVSEWKI